MVARQRRDEPGRSLNPGGEQRLVFDGVALDVQNLSRMIVLEAGQGGGVAVKDDEALLRRQELVRRGAPHPTNPA